MAHVKAGLPEAPNFIPAIKSTLGASGNSRTESVSNKSQVTVSTPEASKRNLTSESENLATAITFAEQPARSIAFLAIFARVGPIFPPAPRTRISPDNSEKSETKASPGSDKCASRERTSQNSGISMFICWCILVILYQL